MASNRSCKNKPNVFCYICGEYTIVPNRNPVTSFIKRAYHAYFNIKLGDQDKAWTPHMVCKACAENLRQWTKGKKSCLKFGIPMIWREPTNHATDCYFCAIDITGVNRKNRSSLKYPDLQSARRPVAHCDEIPVPVFRELPDISDKDPSGDQEDEEDEVVLDDSAPHPFSRNELNDLVRDLSLSKSSAELLASKLKEKNLITDSARITYRNRHQEYLCFFSEEKGLVYCADIAHLLHKLGVPHYEPKDWTLYIDSSKLLLKCFLLHNDNQFASVPLAHATHTLTEKYEAVKYVLEKIRYDQHEWVICVDLKMVNCLLGQESGYTKYPCFLCMWNSRDEFSHFTKKNWPVREELEPCRARNVNNTLVDKDRIIFPPLHIKLDLIKQFTKALDKEGGCFMYLCQAFPGLTMEKLEAGSFDGRQLRQLIRDPEFENSMNEVELITWKAFVLVVKNFLGNNRARNYFELVNDMIVAFKHLGCIMSIKMHYLFSHTDRFPENLGSLSDEHWERFHQEMEEMESMYQGRWDAVMMADYCWTLKRDTPVAKHSRGSNKRKFMP
ncbi:uncharacterized protein [Penaeus vannamei]